MKAIKLFLTRVSKRNMLQCFKRMVELILHYGLPGRFEKTLLAFLSLMDRYNIIPTLPVTAAVVDKNPQLFRKKMRVDWAVHGYKHIDYTHGGLGEAGTHYQKAKNIFNREELGGIGYRFPFLCKNDLLIQTLALSGFQWDSSEAFYWEVIDENLLNKDQQQSLHSILESYQPLHEKHDLCLPFTKGKLIEMPVSIPDDDILLGRLHYRKKEDILQPWQHILEKVKKRGEHFVLQAHPERFALYGEALTALLQLVQQENAWIAPLSDIANWWHQKNEFRFEIKKREDNRWIIKADCQKRATVLLKNSQDKTLEPLNDLNYSVLKGNEWEFHGHKKPVIGLHPELHAEIREFLMEEGYCIEINDSKENYAVYLNQESSLNLKNKVHILQVIEQTVHPLIRFWRWPDARQFAFTVSGDIDAVVLSDYFDRFKG